MTEDLKLLNKKVIVLQRVIPSYRVAVFRSITANTIFDISMIIGDDLDASKAKNAIDLSDVRYHRLPSTGINVLGRLLTRHHGLMSALRESRPDVIICEAESHFLGYLTAILYKTFFSRNTKLILWCFYALPGIENERTPFHAFIKKCSRKFFDGFLSYSSFGKDHLISKGYNDNKITVAVNVCDTSHYLRLDEKLKISKVKAKQKLGISDKFVVTYVGTLDKVKRPDLLLDISKYLDVNAFHFFVVGSGPMEDDLAHKIKNDHVTNVTLTGRLGSDLALYYRASDAVILPGRGGIVISEAMCFGVPVIVHQADGVEYDLVVPGETGILVESGHAADFSLQIQRLSQHTQLLNQMAINTRALIKAKYNTESMSNSVIKSIETVT